MASMITTKPIRGIALFDFEGELFADQISFKRGDRILVSQVNHTSNLASGEVVSNFPEVLEEFNFSENCGWFPFNLVIDIDHVAKLRQSEMELEKHEKDEKQDFSDDPAPTLSPRALEEKLKELNLPNSAPSTLSRQKKVDSILGLNNNNDSPTKNLSRQLSFQMKMCKSASQLFEIAEGKSWEKVVFGEDKHSPNKNQSPQNRAPKLSIGMVRNQRFSTVNFEDEQELKLPSQHSVTSLKEKSARTSRISLNLKTGIKFTKEEHTSLKRIPKHFLPNVLKSLPKVKLQKHGSQKIHAALRGPSQNSGVQEFEGKVFGKCASTYPWPRSEKKRMGDPICDRFSVEIHSNRIIAVVADGCSWGAKPREAAFRASESFINYLNSATNHITKFSQIPGYLLEAVEGAHETIIAEKDDIWDAGTTTLIGGMLLETEEKDEYVFVCVNVGDCKAFLYSRRDHKLTDITVGNRPDNCDTRDPGGRLGPHSRTGEPDFRNLAIYTCLCKKSDIICLVSDGVHDNLDPQLRGILPADLGYSEYKSWQDLEKNHKLCQTIKAQSECAHWLSQVPKNPKPSDFVESALQNSINTTVNIREFLETTPNKRVPADHKKYPGKLDHTTCLA